MLLSKRKQSNDRGAKSISNGCVMGKSQTVKGAFAEVIETARVSVAGSMQNMY